jgi:hypothetical protein
LLAKLDLVKTFIGAAQNSLPLIFVYILAAAPADIIKNSGLSNSLAENVLSENIASSAGF